MKTRWTGNAVTFVAPMLALAACGIWSVEQSSNPRFCDGATHVCADPAFPFCDVAARECVASAVDGGGEAGPGGCKSSTECAGEAAPVCGMAGATGVCRACNGASDDAACAMHGGSTPRCKIAGTNAGHCVACSTSTDCKSGALPVCADDGSCRKCAAHAECPSGACKPDGSCALPSEVAYVDNRGQDPATCMPAGDGNGKATAYCAIQKAVDEVQRRLFIVVAPSAKQYDLIKVFDRVVTIIGPGVNVASRAAIFGSSAAPGVTVAGQSNVILDGLEIANASNNNVGVLCSTGTPTVTIRRSSIHDNNGAGVKSDTCTLSIDASTISNNTGGGLNVNDGTFSITNTFITVNGSNGAKLPGVLFTAGATGTFAFNTVTKNSVSSGIGGINCGLMTTPILNSIVWGNTPQGGTQFHDQCVLTNVVTGADSFLGASMTAPSFVDAANNDFHLKGSDPQNLACCVDKVSKPATANADHDVDGSGRPKGVSWDIGAHEVQ